MAGATAAPLAATASPLAAPKDDRAVWVEPKDWPEQAAEVTTTLELSGLLEDIEQEIAQFWPLNKTITPDEVRGGSTSLKDAIATDGWPLLEDSRGKAIFVLLARGESRDLYVQNHPGLVGARMFTLSDEISDEAAIFSLSEFWNPCNYRFSQ